MYEQFYNLKAEPFRLSPDHRFCFNHRSYAKAKSYMQYAFRRAEGFVMITGRPGTGKTTLVNDLIDDLSPADVSVAMLVSTQLEANDLLRMVAYSFGLEDDLPHKAMIIHRLTRLLTNHHKEGRRALLIIDEAQDLSISALEELRLLTNLQLNSQPLLQIFLLGQEELKDLVHGPSMEQVHQRLVAAYDLEALEENETKQYIKHRLDQVGWKGDPAISEAVFPVIYKFSHGIPRRINLFCSRLFLHGSVEEQHKLGINDARIVIDELQLENLASLTSLSEIDFDVPDKYESINLEPIRKESDKREELPYKSPEEEPVESVAAEPPIPILKRQSRSSHNQQPGTQPPIQKGNAHHQPTENHLQAGSEQPQEIDIKQVVTQSVSKKKREPEKFENHSDESLRIGGREEKPVVENKGSQPTKSGNKFATLVLVLSISLALLAVVLFAVKPRILNSEIEAVNVWLNSMPDRVLALFNENKEPGDLHDGGGAPIHTVLPPIAEKSDVLISPVVEVISKSDKESVPSDQTTSKKSVDNQLDSAGDNTMIALEVEQDTPDDVSDTAGNSLSQLPERHDFSEQEIIPSASLTEQESDSTGPGEDDTPDPGTDEMGAGNNENDSVLAHGNNRDVEKNEPVEKNQLVKKIFFQFDSVDIQSEYLGDLNKIAEQLDASADKKALIIGYSDSAGNKEYNLDLSMKRAHAVASYLGRQGISTDRLRTDGRGTRHTEIESDSMIENMIPDMSRLVEIYFIPSENQ